MCSNGQFFADKNVTCDDIKNGAQDDHSDDEGWPPSFVNYNSARDDKGEGWPPRFDNYNSERDERDIGLDRDDLFVPVPVFSSSHGGWRLKTNFEGGLGGPSRWPQNKLFFFLGLIQTGRTLVHHLSPTALASFRFLSVHPSYQWHCSRCCQPRSLS